MCGPALGCGFICRNCRSSAPESGPAIAQGPIERSGVHPNPGDDASANPGAFEAAEAGGCPQAGTRPFAQAARDANAESVADVGAGAPALAVAAHLGVAVGRRRRSAFPAIKPLLAARWPPPARLVRFFRSMHACGATEAYPPLLAAAIPSEGR
jgi:hypothetical protein